MQGRDTAQKEATHQSEKETRWRGQGAERTPGQKTGMAAKFQGGSCGDQGSTPLSDERLPSRSAPANCFWLSNLNIPHVTVKSFFLRLNLHNPSGHRPQENPNTAFFTVCKADPIRSWISRRPRPRRARRGGRGATLHAEEWLLPLAMACDLESESSVSYQSPPALSRCACDLSQICEIFLCAEPNHF